MERQRATEGQWVSLQRQGGRRVADTRSNDGEERWDDAATDAFACMSVCTGDRQRCLAAGLVPMIVTMSDGASVHAQPAATRPVTADPLLIPHVRRSRVSTATPVTNGCTSHLQASYRHRSSSTTPTSQPDSRRIRRPVCFSDPFRPSAGLSRRRSLPPSHRHPSVVTPPHPSHSTSTCCPLVWSPLLSHLSCLHVDPQQSPHPTAQPAPRCPPPPPRRRWKPQRQAR